MDTSALSNISQHLPNIDVSGVVSQVNLTTPSWDLFIILFFIGAALLYGLTLGRDRIIVILLAIYISFVVTENLPFVNQSQAMVQIGDYSIFKAGLFIVIFIIISLLLSFSGLFRLVSKSDITGKWWQVIVLSFLHIGLLISLTLSFLPEEVISNLTFPSQILFLNQPARILWIILPLLTIVLMREKRLKRKYNE